MTIVPGPPAGSGLRRLGRRARNILRALLQAYGSPTIKRSLWNTEFSGGRWDCLDRTPGDCVYPYVERYANHGSILDLGCGSGSTGNELEATSYRQYTGVDISDVALEKARRRTEENRRTATNCYVQSDIATYVPTRRFDVILFRDSIYYIPYRRLTAMLNRFSHYLEEGGVFIARMAGGRQTYRTIVEAIERHFHVVETHVAARPEAMVMVFRPRSRRPLCSEEPADRRRTPTPASRPASPTCSRAAHTAEPRNPIMIRQINRVVAVGLAVLVWSLATPEADGQGITVTPANPTISVGQTQQFTASGASVAVGLSAGVYHTCAVLQDGTLRCWGQNHTGQLGTGTTNSSTTPVAVVGIADATAVSSGGYHTCARLPDGTLECWGLNDVGQLGNGTTNNATTPVMVSGINTATVVASGYLHTCALLQDGTVRCWGDNSYGELGDGTPVVPPVMRGGPSTAHSSTPVMVSGISTAVAVAATGGFHSCAVLQDGTVRCWGENTYGQLGNGSTLHSSTPVTVSGLTTAVSVTGGDYHTCALLADGTVRCWGLNYSGQLGDGTTNSASTPVPVTGIRTAVAVSAGILHTCALLEDGTVRCWGDNTSGELGNGTTTNSSTPVAVSGITSATAVSSGNNDTCALLLDGSMQCWGLNNYGQLGNGTLTDAHTPVTVAGSGVTWTSSDAAVATIDTTGLATGQGAGSTTITASSDGRSGSTTLTVVDRPTLSVVRAGTGSGTVTSSPAGINCGTTCSAAYDNGTVVTLTATPASGSTFTGWSGCDTVSGSSCTVTMTASRVVTASFTAPQFTLTVTKAGSGSGTVTSSPAGINCGPTCAATYPTGTVVTLTATPAFGSLFTGWSGACSGLAGTCTVTMTADLAVTATFLGTALP